MTAVVFYFQVHQPYRMRAFTAADVGESDDYFDDADNKRLLRRVAERCYVPMNAIIAEAIETTDGAFRCAFSISGTAIRQMRDWCPAALDSFVALAETGNVEFLCETSMHSLAAVADDDEFERQVVEHTATVEDLFGQRPTTFRNTELVISNAIARRVEELGFDVLLGEGADRLLGWRSPHLVYGVEGCDRLKLLLRSYLFSDDIGFRFSNRDWPHYPLFADVFAGWLQGEPDWAEFIGLFMDYETFGEHQWVDTGILEFMRHLPKHVLEDGRLTFATPAETADRHAAVADLDVPDIVSWADQERDLTAWLGNPLQQAAHARLYALARRVRAVADRHPAIADAWHRLTTSDQVYHMCTKHFSDGEVHKYFSPYLGPHDAFVRFMYILDDLEQRLERASTKSAQRLEKRES